ncbi:MAG TPA: hypothetical protein VFU55_07755 [Terracidiphilus sp.]|nr:hypothetical protein [Terracidiphilus sp.]
MCFDTASSYFHDFRDGFLTTPDDARAYFRNQTFEFHAATVFDSSTRRYRDFIDYRKLFDFLITADELVTFNGLICDLIVLEERMGGKEMVQQLWQKPHYDIAGVNNYQSLPDTISIRLPKKASSFSAVEFDRLEKIRGRFTDFQSEHLANTYRDAKFTYMLFREYERRGWLHPPKMT